MHVASPFQSEQLKEWLHNARRRQRDAIPGKIRGLAWGELHVAQSNGRGRSRTLAKHMSSMLEGIEQPKLLDPCATVSREIVPEYVPIVWIEFIVPISYSLVRDKTLFSDSFIWRRIVQKSNATRMNIQSR